MTEKSNTGSGQRQGESDTSKAARDNRSDQLNHNNDKYYQARGLPGRPDGSGGESPSNPRKG